MVTSIPFPYILLDGTSIPPTISWSVTSIPSPYIFLDGTSIPFPLHTAIPVAQEDFPQLAEDIVVILKILDVYI